MTSIIASAPKSFAAESGHWYTKTGEPMYEIIGANGKKRATRITDARKLGLVPSVSTIMKLEAKPQLTNWLVQQGMLACLTLPRNPGEDDTTFIKRALDDSKQQVIKAADRGSYLHGLLENSMRDGHVYGTAEDEPFIRPVFEYVHDTFPGYVWRPERSFARDLSTGRWFGGKTDLTGTHASNQPVQIDYKCKDFVKGTEKVLAYDEHVTQLASYGFGIYGTTQITALNIFVSTREPTFVPVNWSQPEIDRGWCAFKALLELWYARNDL